MPDDSYERPPIRVLLAVGNPERERRLRDALSAEGLVVAGRCLDAPSLVERASGMDIDAALASSDLHRLSAGTLVAVREARLPLVLLAEPTDLERYAGLAHLMPAGAAGDEVAAALREAMARGPVYGVVPTADGSQEGSEALAGGGSDDGSATGQVVAVVSGKGAPGKTTLAIGLAAALAERGRRVVLVDADLRGGNVGPYLDLDLRLGILGLSFGRNGVSETGRIDEELQEGPGFMVLAGVERPEMGAGVPAELLTGIASTLRERFDDVIVDAGELIGGTSSPATTPLLRAANRVLVVSGADLVALWNARSALRHLREAVGIVPEVVAVVLNRSEGRGHYDGGEVQRALGVPVLAVVPEDRRAARQAIDKQLPMTALGGRATRELKALASRLVTETPATSRSRGRRWLPSFRPTLVRRR